MMVVILIHPVNLSLLMFNFVNIVDICVLLRSAGPRDITGTTLHDVFSAGIGKVSAQVLFKRDMRDLAFQ